jgi:enoyl-[acyl-carrier protein] reductase II
MIIEKFLNVGRKFLGCKDPIMCGAMTWISDPQLVSAVSGAGGFGLIAGGIATGRMMAHLLMMGAAGIQMGTRFVMSEECTAYPKFKEVFRRAKAKDAIATPQFDGRLPVIPVRALKNEGTIEFAKLRLELLNKLGNCIIDREEAQFEVERFWVGALKNAAVDGEITKGSLMAGQSVGLVNEIKPLKRIFDEMVNDAETELQRLKRLFIEESSKNS